MASTTVASNAFVREVLDHHNYEDWSSRVETYLLAEDLWDVVNTEPPNKPHSLEGEAEYKAWTTKNAKALHAIKNSCGAQLFSFIRDTRTAKIAWEVLEKQFKLPHTVRLEKKEREEREKSLHTLINVAGQTRDERKELVQANEALEIKPTGDLERETSLHNAMDARQTCDAVEELVPADDDEELQVKTNECGDENKLNYEYDSSYNPFFNFVVNGDWDHAKECLATLHPDTVRVIRYPVNGCIALHVAAANGHMHIIKELMPLMTQEDLEIKDNNGFTALHCAVYRGNVDIVKELVSSMRQEGLEIKAKNGITALHAAVGKVNVDIVKELVSSMREEALEIKENDGLTALHCAVYQENVDIVKELVSSMRQEGLEIETKHGITALHAAVGKVNVDIVKELVSSMREEALEIKNVYDMTPLGTVLGGHNSVDNGDMIKMTKYMVEKNKKILHSRIGFYNYIPVVQASSWKRWELTRYLYSVTPPEALESPENKSQGATLICYCLNSKELDIAWNLLSRCPSLTIAEAISGGSSPILSLVRMHSAFLRDMRLRFWQKWIYDRIPIQPSTDSSTHDISIIVSNSEDDRGNQRGPMRSVMSLLRRLVKGLLELLGIKRISEMKSTHDRIFEFICCMGTATVNILELTLAETKWLHKSMMEAIEQGNVEFITHMCKANPNFIHMLNDKQMSIFHFAIECRQEEIYSLIYGLEKEKRKAFGLRVASFNNNMLHGAGNLSPLLQFNRIQVAHLQMQRELQWFKEVESIVPIAMHESRNKSENLTPRELFHKNHKKLMEEAELSIKGTATSCTVIGALIVTIMFAAAFTVPGGNNGNTGLPMLIDENLFLGFIVSDTIALVSSTTAVVVFLEILTSRYSEDDYLKNLPTKMMIGLFALFISIATMMAAFCCGLVIMLHGRYSWVAIPSILVASIPVISFIWMLFPLLVQTFISTYGPGIFNKKVKPWIEL